MPGLFVQKFRAFAGGAWGASRQIARLSQTRRRSIPPVYARSRACPAGKATGVRILFERTNRRTKIHETPRNSKDGLSCAYCAKSGQPEEVRS